MPTDPYEREAIARLLGERWIRRTFPRIVDAKLRRIATLGLTVFR